MLTLAHRRPGARPGFSLLELTLVLVILGLLLAVAAVNFAGAAERSKIKVTRSKLQVIKSQIVSYQIANSVFPETMDVLVQAKYLEGDKLKDAWNSDFYYKIRPEARDGYELISAGPDRAFETEDDLSIYDEVDAGGAEG